MRYFPDDQIRITCFSRHIYNPLKLEDPRKDEIRDEKIRERGELLEYDPEEGRLAYKFVEGKTILNPFTGKITPFTIMKDRSQRTDSIKRAIDKAFEIGLANDFKYFITLTLDKEKIDRYDRVLIYKKLRSWLCNRVQRNKMDYILFPEYHKLEDGQTERAIHFHGLVNAEGLDLVDSGRKTKAGQEIFNLTNWKYGFSTVIELDGRTAIVRYVTKYITKGNEKIFGKYYLSGGKTLKREVPAEYLNLDYNEFDGQEYHIPAAGMSVKYKTYNLGDINMEDLKGIEGDDDSME